MSEDCNTCPPEFGQNGFYETNADRIPVPGGYSPSEQIVYAEAMACLCETTDIATLRTLFLLLIQAHWSHKDNFGPHINNLGCLVFTREPDSPIVIRLTDDFKPDEAFSKPSIYVHIDQMAFQKLTQDNRDGFSPDLGTVYRSWRTLSTLTVSHYHSSEDIAFKMADNSMYFLLGIRESIMQKLPLPMFEPQSVGPAQKTERNPDVCFRVDSKINFNGNYNISTSIESHRLKQFAISVAPK
jgi:hypothetical protein